MRRVTVATTHGLALSLSLLIQAVSAQVTTTSVYGCSHVESDLAQSMKGSAMEYHCVEALDGVPSYVTGVSSMMMYFEGPISAGSAGGYSANLNWFGPSVSEDGASPVPQSGAAHVEYDNSFSMAGWAAWNTGTSDLTDSYAAWNSTLCVPMQMTETEMAAMCLRSPQDAYSNQQLHAMLDMTSWTWVSGSGVGGELQVCTQGYSTLSSYTQSWPASACVDFFGALNASAEPCGSDSGPYANEGALWKNGLHFQGRASFGVTAVWETTSGPMHGILGPILAVVTVEGGVPKLRGFSCMTDVESGETTVCWPEELTLTSADKACDATKPLEPRETLPAKCEGAATFEEPEVEVGVINASTMMLVCTGTREFNGTIVTQETETHCVDTDSTGEPFFVRGSYGSRGYFEGKMEGGRAWVSWYGVEMTADAGRVPMSGAAVLEYDLQGGSAMGPTWVSGQRIAAAHGTHWQAMNCAVEHNPSEARMARDCLWSPQANARAAGARVKREELDETVWLGEGAEVEAHMLRVCHDDQNTLVPYKNETYGLDSLRFLGASATGFVGVFRGEEAHEEVQLLVGLTYEGEEPVLRGWRCEWREDRYGEDQWGCNTVEMHLQPEAAAECGSVIRSECELGLSWEELKLYRSNQTMYTGGLGDLERTMGVSAWAPHGRHYGVWTCVRDWDKKAQVRCGGGPGRFVCFQYEDVEGRFEFWGLNRKIRMVPPFN